MPATQSKRKPILTRKVRLLSYAFILSLSVGIVYGSYRHWDNRHIVVVHSSYVLNKVHPMVRERYHKLRELLYANRHSKQDIVKLLVKEGLLMDSPIQELEEVGRIRYGDSKELRDQGEVLVLANDGQIYVAIKNWKTDDWVIDLELNLPFGVADSMMSNRMEYVKFIALSPVPF